MLTQLELGEVVGFLEGEGSFSWHRSSTSGSPVVAAAQVQLWPLTQLHRFFGGHISLKKAHPPSQACHFWYVSGPTAVGLMMTIYYRMSPRRQHQIRTVLEKWKSIRPDFKYRTHCKNGHPYDTENTRTYINYNGQPARECRTCRKEIYHPRSNAKAMAKRRTLRLLSGGPA